MKLTTKLLKSIIKEEVRLFENSSADELKLKKNAIDSLIALYFRHDMSPEEVSKELAIEAQRQINDINTSSRNKF